MNYKEDQEALEEAKRLFEEEINKNLHYERKRGEYTNVDKWLSDIRTHINGLRLKDFF